MTTYKLKIHLIESGKKEHKCENCNLTSWLNSLIPLELHHVDGNSKNNELNNIQLLCPNCHALTPNYRGKNKKREKKQINVPDEVIIKIVPTCYTIRHVLLEVGLVAAGANYARVKSIMIKNKVSFKKKQISDSSEKRLNTIRLKYGSIKESTRTRIVWPERDVLEKDIREHSLSFIGRKLGVSTGAIKKHAKKYGIDVSQINPWCKKHGSRSGI